jgi:DNA-directed RNA polymerase subunit RPC12/RpoP
MGLKREAAKCRICGKTLLPEEIEVGTSLVCPRCSPKPKSRDGKDRQRSEG